MKLRLQLSAAVAIVAFGLLFPVQAVADCSTNVAAIQRQIAQTESQIRALHAKAERQFDRGSLRRIRELSSAGWPTERGEDVTKLRNLARVIEREYVAKVASLMTGVETLRQQIEGLERDRLEYAVLLPGSFSVPLPDGGEVIFRRDSSVHNFRFWSATVCPAFLSVPKDGQSAWKELVGRVELKEGLTTRQVEALRNVSPEDRQEVLYHIDGWPLRN